MRTRLSLRLLSTLGVFSSAMLVTSGLLAQEVKGKDGEFSVQRFEPAAGSKNFLTTEGARMDAKWGWTAGLMFNYANKPFVVVSCKTQTDCSSPNATNAQNVAVIKDMFTADVLASLTPIPALQIGLRVPVAYVSGDGIDLTTGGPINGGLKGFGVGDADVEAKFRFYGDPKTSAVVLGGALDVAAPLGDITAKDKYIGNSLPVTAGGRLIFDGSFGPLSFGINLRGIYRATGTLGSTSVGPEFRYSAAVGYQVSPIFKVMADAYGGTQFSPKNGTNALEVDGAIQISPLNSGLVLTAGGGAGVLQGVGVPAFRALAGVGYGREIGDQDADGINDRDDKCPTVGEDKDEFEDDDGCPEDDNDQDKIVDAKDKCPNKPETINGFQDDDGCPDELADRDKDGIGDNEDKCPDDFGKMRVKEFYGCPDKDGDGVADKADGCPDQPEDTDGFADTDGCPDPDNDGDKIPDELDECIDQPEVYNGFKDEDGCPDSSPDTDKDGIPDDKDKCPKQPENLNGFEDEDGCPDKGPSLVQVTEDDIKILQRVEFATNSDKIQGATSFAVLNAVASVLNIHKEIFLVEVAGHTDNAGKAEENRTLSQKRADAVVKYLVDKGIDKGRLQAKGYGPDKPVADNKTTQGKQKNRRVEFNILKSAKKSDASAAAAPAKP